MTKNTTRRIHGRAVTCIEQRDGTQRFEIVKYGDRRLGGISTNRFGPFIYVSPAVGETIEVNSRHYGSKDAAFKAIREYLVAAI